MTSNEPTRSQKGWAGLISFAAVMLILLGGFHAMGGLMAVFQEETYRIANTDLIVNVDYTVWGLVHIGLGVVLAMAGYGLFYRKTWARIVGIVVAFISAVTNFAFLPAYPVWYTLMIGIDVLVIWALTAHADDGNWQLV